MESLQSKRATDGERERRKRRVEAEQVRPNPSQGILTSLPTNLKDRYKFSSLYLYEKVLALTLSHFLSLY